MSIFNIFQRLLRTASWRQKQAQVLASERFHAFDRHSAVLVLDCLVDMLGVDFQQLHPTTELAKDLGADEDEPQWIASCLQELGICLSSQQIADARTVGNLIELVSRVTHEHAA